MSVFGSSYILLKSVILGAAKECFFLSIPGEHCEAYVKHFQTLFTSNDNTSL
jgi:hypothetical protein